MSASEVSPFLPSLRFCSNGDGMTIVTNPAAIDVSLSKHHGCGL